MISNIYLNYYYVVFAKFFQDRKRGGEDVNLTSSNCSAREICCKKLYWIWQRHKAGPECCESRETRWEQLYLSNCREKPGQLRQWIADLWAKVGLWSGKQLSHGMPHGRGGQAWATRTITNSSAMSNLDLNPHHQTSPAPCWTVNLFDLNSQHSEKEYHFPSLNINSIVNSSKTLLWKV